MRKTSVILLTRTWRRTLRRSDRGKPILPMLQVLVALRIFADGSVHRVGCDLFNISEASVCRIVHRVAKSLCLRRDQYISFPDADEREAIKRSFYEEYQFPGMYIIHIDFCIFLLIPVIPFTWLYTCCKRACSYIRAYIV